MSGDQPDDPARKQPDVLRAKALERTEAPKEPLPPPVWDEPDDDVPTEVLGPPLPLAAARPAPQATQLDLAYRPLVVHPQPVAEGDAPYADTAIRPVVEPSPATSAVSAFEPDDEEDPTIVIPVLTPAVTQAVVPAGLASKAPVLAAVKPSGSKQRR